MLQMMNDDDDDDDDDDQKLTGAGLDYKLPHDIRKSDKQSRVREVSGGFGVYGGNDLWKRRVLSVE